jgi:hypothetical protein
LNAIPDDEWDRQMKAEAEAGKLDQFIEEAETERKAGVLREFPAPGQRLGSVLEGVP